MHQSYGTNTSPLSHYSSVLCTSITKGIDIHKSKECHLDDKRTGNDRSNVRTDADRPDLG